ncbi:hypothetical protein NKH18_12625 [Streptomyces sp. M10(2022)]
MTSEWKSGSVAKACTAALGPAGKVAPTVCVRRSRLVERRAGDAVTRPRPVPLNPAHP